MFSKFCALLHKYWEIISYILFGGLTTVVNFVVYYPLLNYLGFSAALSNAAAWIAAVIFAYLTNKLFVFQSKSWSAKTVVPELLKFVGCRVGSGLLETAVLLVTVDMMCWDGNLWKLLTSILVIIINYIGSKVLVFRK